MSGGRGPTAVSVTRPCPGPGVRSEIETTEEGYLVQRHAAGGKIGIHRGAAEAGRGTHQLLSGKQPLGFAVSVYLGKPVSFTLFP